MDEKYQCTRIKKNGERCKAPSLVGLTVCRIHGGQLPALRAKSEKAKVLMAMEKFVTPIPANDPEADFITAFETEFRRTVARIRYFDEKLAELREEELIWGKTKEEDIDAAEYPGVNRTFEAKANMYHQLQWEERQHLVKMTKVYMAAKVDERRLQIMEREVLALDKAITTILGRLGHNPKDPEVRSVIREELLAIAAPARTHGPS